MDAAASWEINTLSWRIKDCGRNTIYYGVICRSI